MGRRRPLRMALGLGVLSAALAAGIAVAAASASPPESNDVVRGRVESNGTTTAGDDWTVRHRTAGEYRLEFDGHDVRLDIDRWDAVADATVIPLGGGTEVVRFTNGDTPVDSGFSFTAILSH